MSLKRPFLSRFPKIFCIEKFLLIIVILLEFTVISYLILTHRMADKHDGFYILTFQYYFLNNVAVSREIPQWLPFISHGVPTSWWYTLNGMFNIFTYTLLLSGSLIRHIDFLTIFHLGFFVDEMLLLIGVWLLAKRYFNSAWTLFFLATMILGSCIWMSQPSWNFHSYFAIPLILHLLHRFLETQKWRYCYLAINLLAFQTLLDNMAYLIGVISLVVFLYFLFYCLFNLPTIWQQLKNLRWGWSFLEFLGGVIFTLAVIYSLMVITKDNQLVLNTYGRNPDGSVSLTTFLNYGKWSNLFNWTEMFLRISPSLDYTLYIGIIALPLILIGLFTSIYQKKNLHLLCLILTLLFFTNGTFVSVSFYHFWPLMKFFRHLSLITPIIKLFLCFLAGLGFEAIFINGIFKEHPKIFNRFLIIIALVMLSFSSILILFACDPVWAHFLINKLFYQSNNLIYSFKLDKGQICFRLAFCSFYIFLSSLLIGVLPFINFKRYRNQFIITALLVHLFDLYEYKMMEIKYRTGPLNQEQYSMIQFQPLPYAQRRDINFFEHNPRLDLLQNVRGVFYWTTNAILFKDQLGTPGRVDFWSLPLDNYMRAFWGQPLEDFSVKTLGVIKHTLRFPIVHPAIFKISGVTEDKIQFFSNAFLTQTDRVIANSISHPNYQGDMLFLSYPNKIKINEKNLLLWSNAYPLSSNMRLHLPYQILRFDSNHLELSVDVPSDYSSMWMMYADVWHPQWKVTLNGKPTTVFKADLAYKAVRLNPGPNKVHFYFKSKLLTFLQYLVGLNSAFWLGMILWLTKELCLGKEKSVS